MNWGYAFPDEQHEQQQQQQQQQQRQFGYRFGGGGGGNSVPSGAAFDGPDVTLSNPPPLNLRHPYDDGAFDDAIMDPSLMLFGDQQFDGISPTSLGSATSLLACSPMNRNNAVAIGVTADVPKQEVAIASTAASASTSAGGDSKKKKANDSKAKPKFNTFKEKSDVALQRENDAKIRFDQVRLAMEDGSENFEPGSIHHITLLEPAIHLTGACYKDFRLYVSQHDGWAVTRRKATADEKANCPKSKDLKRTVYFVSVTYRIPFPSDVPYHVPTTAEKALARYYNYKPVDSQQEEDKEEDNRKESPTTAFRRFANETASTTREDADATTSSAAFAQHNTANTTNWEYY